MGISDPKSLKFWNYQIHWTRQFCTYEPIQMSAVKSQAIICVMQHTHFFPQKHTQIWPNLFWNKLKFVELYQFQLRPRHRLALTGLIRKCVYIGQTHLTQIFNATPFARHCSFHGRSGAFWTSPNCWIHILKIL